MRQLREYVGTGEGHTILEAYDRELYFLRWLKGSDRQDIVFVDPHGLIIGSNLDVNPKVQFYRTIKEYETKLNHRAGRDDIALHSYIVSQTPFQQLRQ